MLEVQAGSARAIWRAFLILVDEMLHALDGIDFIGNAEWRFRFCQYAHKEENMPIITAIRDDGLPMRHYTWFDEVHERLCRGEQLTFALNGHDIDWLRYLGFPVEEAPAAHTRDSNIY